MALALLALFTWVVVWQKPKTPFVFITATDYQEPFPLNPWALEDRKSLQALNGQNLRVLEHLPDWNESVGKFEVLPKTLDLSGFRKEAPLIVYVSAHGIVKYVGANGDEKEDGEPCLLPPGASIHDSKTWIPVADVLDEIKEKVPSRNILLILDSNRIRVNWSLGVVYNTFAERIAELVNRKNLPNVAVLISASPGQVNWTSADFRGSVFARYLQLGLAGAADADNDGVVNLQELATYLKREVSGWSQHNRGEPQEPMVIPKDADFHVTRALNGFKNSELAASQGSPDDSELWSKLDVLRKHLVRFDPIACREFEHQLLRLEELSEGGEAYVENAKELRKNIEKTLSDAVEHVPSIAADSRKAADYYGLTNDAAWLHIEGVGHTLPSCEYFGLCDTKQSAQIRDMWTRLIDPHQTADADTIVESTEVAKLAQQLAETQFLAALRQQQALSLWPIEKWKEVLNRRIAAENLALPRDATGIPADERAHWYARVALDEADKKRRLAEDVLFVGQPAQEQYKNVANRADDLNRWTRQVLDDATAAFHVRDSVFAEGPYLAEWVCDPLSMDAANRDDLVNKKLVPLFQNANLLSESANRLEELHEAKWISTAESVPFRSQTKLVQADFDTVKSRYESNIKELTEHDSDEPEIRWRRLEAVLRTPLILGPTRAALLKKQTTLAKTLHDDYESEKKHDEPKEKEKLSYLEAAHRWKVYPLFEILRAELPHSNQKALIWSDQAAAAARLSLKVRDEATSDRHEPPAHVAADKVLEERNRRFQAESEMRSKAALIDEPSEGASDTPDAIVELRRFDTEQLLIWHAKRAMADSWLYTVKPDAAKPFFQIAANDFLRAAKRLNDPPNPAVSAQIDRDEQSLQAKGDKLPIKADAHLTAETEGAAVVSVEVGNVPAATRSPIGAAAVYLRDDKSHRLSELQLKGNPSDSAPLVVLSPKGTEPQKFEANIANTSSVSSSLNAIAYFRGRESPVDFRLPVANGIRIDYEPHQYKDQSVTLFGDRLQRSSIEFILDCSYSMKDPTLKTAEEQGKAEKAERLSLAKEQVKTMLNELVARNGKNEEIRVGVWFFGHRVGWGFVGDKPTGNLSTQDDYLKHEAELPNKGSFEKLKPDAERIGPSRDIEKALSLGKFGYAENDGYLGIKTQIDWLKPWGETPLYLALQEAERDFANEERNSRKSIIAITDGKNNQTTPDTTIRDVENAFDVAKVPIHILGFDIPTNEAAEAEAAYNELTKYTNGKFFKVTNGYDLLRQLRAQLKADLYTVPETGPTSFKLGERVPIANELLSKKLTVSFNLLNKPVHLEGGEAIALFASENGQDIVAHPYNRPVANQAALLGDPGRIPVLLRAHWPQKDKNAVRFPISIQVDPSAYHFTERPAETWVEITPLGDSASPAQSYVFYDVNFEPQTPVPVLEWTALNWPEYATKARIRFWCKSQATSSTKIPLGDLFAGKRFGSVNLTAKPMSDGNKYWIRIEEHYEPPSQNIYDLRVSFETQSHEKPLRVVHQFDAQRGVAIHSYYFSPALRENIERPGVAHVLIASAQEVKDGALHLSDDGLVVPISAAVEVFSPSATAHGR